MTVVYYEHELDTTMHVNGTITGAVASGLEEALLQFLDEIQEPGAGVKTLKFLMKSSAVSQAVLETVDVYFNGDQLVIGSALVDASATALITYLATALTGWNPIALAVGASLYWSAVNDEAVEQFFTDVNEFYEWMTGTIDIDVQLVDKTSGNLYAGGFYADGLGSVTPSEAVVALLENAADLGVSSIDPTQHVVKIYEGEESQEPELIHDFDIYAPELAAALANAMTAGSLATFRNYSDHATKIAEIDTDFYIVDDRNYKLYVPVTVSGTILSESMDSFGPGGVNYTSTTGGYMIIGAEGFHNETFHGEEYANIFFGLGGNDIFKAAESSDYDKNELDGDVFFGGDLHDTYEMDPNIAGVDTVDYSDYEVRGVAVSLSQAAGHADLIGQRAQAYWDGNANGKQDRLYSIENIVGTKWDDLIEGSYHDNSLTGGAGNDWFVATRGYDDTYSGGAGSDTVDYSGLTAGISVVATASNAITVTKANGDVDTLYTAQ